MSGYRGGFAVRGVAFVLAGAVFALGVAGRAADVCVPGGAIRTFYNPEMASGDEFSQAIAISGNLAVIGGGAGAGALPGSTGAAYVFDLTTGLLLNSLINPNPAGQDFYGRGVSIGGNIAVVGADRENIGDLTQAGRAYVFAAQTGTLLATLQHPNPETDGIFGGQSVVNGELVAVGDYRDTVDGVVQAGSAFLFNAISGDLLRTFNSPNPLGWSFFGARMAFEGDVLAITQIGGTSAGVPLSGIAYLFSASTGALLHTLVNPVPTENSFFGSSISMNGGVVVVGAEGTDPGGVTDAGAAYAFSAATGELLGTFVNPAPGEGDLFGRSVSVSGDLTAIGAWHDSPAGLYQAGSAYLFRTSDRTLLKTLTHPHASAGDAFGQALAVSGSNVLVGSYTDDVGDTVDTGSAYLFGCTAPGTGREVGDFDSSGCTDLTDFLFLVDYWSIVSPLGGDAISLTDFLAVVDNWSSGPTCPQ